jgi:hypothetical protein
MSEIIGVNSTRRRWLSRCIQCGSTIVEPFDRCETCDGSDHVSTYRGALDRFGEGGFGSDDGDSIPVLEPVTRKVIQLDPHSFGDYCVRRCGNEKLWSVGFWKAPGEFVPHSDFESEREAEDCAEWLNSQAVSR